MKFQDLTKEQQDHLTTLISKYGEPPEGCTHFDMTDSHYTSFTKSSQGCWSHQFGDGCWTDPALIDAYDGSLFVQLPEPPYYTPESVAFRELPKSTKPLVQQQAIIQCYLIDTFGCSDREALAHSRLIIQEIT